MRWIVRGVTLVVVLLTLSLGGVYYSLDDAAETAIERGGEVALGVPTSVESVSVQPLVGRIDINAVQIANPEGFSDDPFFSLGGGSVEVDLATVLGDVVVLPLIALHDIELRLELVGRRANYQGLMGERGADAPTASQGEGGGPGVMVRELRIERVTAHLDGGVVLGNRRGLVVEVPEIVLHDIGTETEGVPTEELAEIVIDAVLAALASEGIRLPTDLIADLKDLPLEVRGEIEKERQALEAKALEKAGDAIGDALGSGTEAASGALDSLLGRD